MADNIIVAGLVQASAQNTPAVIRAIETGGVYTLVVSGGGGGGATIPATTNLIAGDGAGNGADSGKAASDIPVLDTGWSANANAGDKSLSVVAYVSPNMSGLDTVDVMKVQDLSNAFETLSAKFRAVESALAGKLLPNA